MLQIQHLSRAFGGVYAVNDVTLSVPDGQLRGVIGPNGAGKSTLFSLISGHLRPGTGTVSIDGARIDRMPVHKRARLGVATVFQGARLFTGMTVLENVAVGATATTRAGMLAATLRLRGQRREEQKITADAAAALAQVGLSDWADRSADALPLGQQRRVQVARALAAGPRLLLLDEPASGLRAEERADLADLIGGLHAQGITIMLIEHDVSMVMTLCEQVTVLDLGEVIAEGTPDQVRHDGRVIRAYLGTAAVEAGDSHARTS